MWTLIVLILALVVFVIAAIPSLQYKVNLIAVGLALVTLSFILSHFGI